MSLDEVPMYVKEGTILPLAKPVEYINRETVLELDCYVYGKAPRSFRLFEDNGYTFDYLQNQYNQVVLNWNKNRVQLTRQGSYQKQLYRVASWKQVE